MDKGTITTYLVSGWLDSGGRSVQACSKGGTTGAADAVSGVRNIGSTGTRKFYPPIPGHRY